MESRSRRCNNRNSTTPPPPAELLLNEPKQQVLACVEGRRTPIDQIIAASGMPVAQMLATPSVLELRRLIRRVGGNLVARP